MSSENGGLAQARSKLDTIVQLSRIYEKTQKRSDWDRGEMISEAIQEMPLSVEVRSDWNTVGDEFQGGGDYKILLCTGGPACRIFGGLDEMNQPITARIEGQDWYTPWERIDQTNDETDALVAFASHFWFGE